MKNFLRNYFTFSTTDRNGIAMLALILLAMLVAPLLFPTLLHRPPENFSHFEQEMSNFKQNLTDRQVDAKQEWDESRKKYRRHTSFAENGYTDREYDTYSKYKRQYRQNSRYDKNKTDDQPTALSEPFPFNPNELTYEQGIQLGLSPKLSHTIVNYLEKNGRFRRKEDLKKIYGMNESDYARLEPYINLDDKSATNSKNLAGNNESETEYEAASARVVAESETTATGGGNKAKPDAMYSPTTNSAKSDAKTYKDPNAKIDINTADTTEWQKLRGIGSSRARSIVKFREALGGFSSIEQVAETRGLEEVFATIKNNLINPNTDHIKKINLSMATKEELQKHPYIDGKTADIIVKYRKQHGKYSSATDLQKTGVIDDNLLRKLQPYLTVN